MTAPVTSLARDGVSFPPRRAASTPGWEGRASPTLRTSAASPTEAPVTAASQSAGDRWPRDRWAWHSAARAATRVSPAAHNRLPREKAATSEAASSPS